MLRLLTGPWQCPPQATPSLHSASPTVLGSWNLRPFPGSGPSVPGIPVSGHLTELSQASVSPKTEAPSGPGAQWV